MLSGLVGMTGPKGPGSQHLRFLCFRTPATDLWAETPHPPTIYVDSYEGSLGRHVPRWPTLNRRSNRDSERAS